MHDGYDIIGDIHGHAAPLERLLAELGYVEEVGVYRHPNRRVVFVGDLIDRGPGQVRVLVIARAMVDSGMAQMTLGNHEFNAIAWATPRPGGGHHREHNEKHRGQHQAFLAQVGEDSDAHREWIAWFKTLPLWLDLGGIRVVHACWDPLSMEKLGGPTLTDEMIAAAKGSVLDDAIEVVLKGPEIDLGGRCYQDKDGNARHRARARWWAAGATTLATAALIPGGSLACDGGEFAPLPDDPIAADLPVAPTGSPVFYGHYWRKGTPSIDTDTVACLDWSVAKGGPLVAYRWSGETTLDNANFVAVH